MNSNLTFNLKKLYIKLKNRHLLTTSELLTSPQLKRKASRNLEAPSAKEEDERCEPNNKAFTNYLRDSLAELAENERDFGLTVGQYGSKYPVEINKIKRELVKFIPIGSTFEKGGMSNTLSLQIKLLIPNKN